MLYTLKEILENTKKEKYAVGAFNFNSFEDAQGMLDGAREMKSPIILMASMGAVRHIGTEQCVAIVRGMAKTAGIPVCLHLDHATDSGTDKRLYRCGVYFCYDRCVEKEIWR